MALPSTRHSGPVFCRAVNQYMKAICKNKPTVASEIKCIDNPWGAILGGVLLSKRSNEQYAPSGKNIPQNTNRRSKGSAALSNNGLRYWIESITIHTITLTRRV